MDMPFDILGPHHRQARHSPIELYARYMDDPARMNAAFAHLITDLAGTADPNFRMLLDAMGMWYSATQRQQRLQEKIQELRRHGKDISAKLQEKAQVEHDVEIASMSLMLAMLP